MSDNISCICCRNKVDPRYIPYGDKCSKCYHHCCRKCKPFTALIICHCCGTQVERAYIPYDTCSKCYHKD